MKNHVAISSSCPSGQETFGPFGDPDARQRDGRDARCDACLSADPAPDARPRACGCPFVGCILCSCAGVASSARNVIGTRGSACPRCEA